MRFHLNPFSGENLRSSGTWGGFQGVFSSVVVGIIAIEQVNWTDVREKWLCIALTLIGGVCALVACNLKKDVPDAQQPPQQGDHP
jgi:hypothetical protein